MAMIFADLVQDTTTTTGTGNVTVSGSPPSSAPAAQTFSAACAPGDTFYGQIRHQTANEWEVGIFTYNGSNVIARTSVIASSAGTAHVSFSAGSKLVTLQVPLEIQKRLDNIFVQNSATGVGVLVGRSSTNSDYSTWIGYGAGYSMTNSQNAMALGRSAGENANNCVNLVAIGASCARNAANNASLLALGEAAGYAAAASDYATLFGPNAGENLDACPLSMLLGASAGRFASNSESVIAIGQEAYGGNDTGDCDGCQYSIFAGYASGRHVHDNTYSVVLGYAAGEYANNASDSFMACRFAGIYANDSPQSIMIGPEAGINASQSPGAVLIGYQAGQSEFSSSAPGTPLAATRPIYIGNQAGLTARGTTDVILIGAGSNASENVANAVGIGTGVSLSADNTFIIPGALSLGLGTDTPLTGLHVNNLGSAAITPLSAAPATGAILGDESTDAVLNAGVNGSNAGFLQVREKTAAGAALDFAVNPLGGKLGVGTDAPLTGLHVNNVGSASITPLSAVPATGALLGDGSTDAVLNAGVNGTAAGFLQVREKSAAGAALDLAVNPLGGKLGVGTATPLTGLHVNNLGTGAITPLSAVPASGALLGDGTTDAVLNAGVNGTDAAYLQAREKTAAGAALNLAVNPLGGKLGVGTAAPLTGLHANNLGNGAITPLSAVPASGALLGDGTTDAVLNAGVDGTDAAYLQAREKTAAGAALDLAVNPLGGRLGVGTAAPLTGLHVNNLGNGAITPLSAVPASGALLGDGSTDAVLNAGVNGTDAAYLQAREKTAAGAALDLAVNPLGGKLGVGTAAPLTGLHVNNLGSAAIAPLSAVPATGALLGDGTTNAVLNAGVNGTDAAYLQAREKTAAGAALDLAVNPLGGRLGVGTAAPLTGLHVNNLGSGAITPLSAAPASGAVLGDGTTDAVLNAGVNGTDAAYLQAREKTAAGTALNLAVNPLGGKLGVGTAVPLTGLHVNNLGTGAITPLSAVPATGALLGDGTTDAVLNVGVNGTDAAYLQAREKSADGDALDLAVNPLGGNVGVGVAPACKLDVGGPVRVKSYTVATVPDATLGDFQIIGVTDESGGPCLAVSYAGNWKRLTLGPNIS